MAILLVGCEVGEGERKSGKGSTGVALSAHRYFAHEISLGVDTTAPHQGLRARDFDPGDIVQNVLTPSGEKEVPLDPGPDGVMVAYAPLDLENSPFRWVRNWRDVLPSSGHTFGGSTGSRTIVWTVPEYDPVENPILFSAFGQSGVLTGRSVTINEAWTFENYPDNGLDPSQKSPPVVSVQISGVDFGDGPSSFSGMAQAYYQFSSTLPGLHTLENRVVNGSGTQLEGNWSYYQRRMEFAEEFPEYDDSTTDPVEIQNSLQWNDGSAAGEAEWEVSVGDLRKEGTGSEIYALWKPVEEALERYVDPATVPVGETLQRTPLSVKARTPAFFQRWDETGPLYYNITGGTDVPKRTRIKIIEEDVAPEEPFEGDSTSATVTAEVIYFDPELIPQDINWQVDIKNSAGEVVWNKLAAGTGCDISAVWDGTIEGEPLPPDDNDPKTYSFALSAFLCDGDGGVVVSGRALDDVRPQTLGSEECPPDPKALALVDVSVGKVGELKVFASEAEIANSNDKAKRGGATNDAGFTRLGTVHAAETWKLELSGLDFGADTPPTTLSGFAISSVSSPSAQEPVTLTKDPNREGVYIADFEPSTLLKTGPQLGNTLYSVGAGVAVKDGGGTVLISHFYADLLADILQGTTFYPADRKELGRLVYTGLLGRAGATEAEILPNEAEFVPSNVKKFGFEAIIITILTPKGPLDVTVKVQNRASDFATFSHGLFDGRLLLGTSDSGDVTINPEDFTDDEVSHLKTWIFNACNVLICYDYNNNLADRTDLGRQGRADPISVRAPGAHGLRWWNKLNKGRTVLLGYNFPVEASDAARATSAFQAELNGNLSVSGVQITNDNKQQFAWLVANARLGGTAWNACAWDSQFYYYLAKYERKYDPDSGLEGKPEESIYGIIRLPLDPQTGVPSYINTNGERQPYEPNSPQGPPKYAQRFPVN